MKRLISKKYLATAGALFLCLLFQNAAYTAIPTSPMNEINNKVRKAHAKELLGKSYKGSSAHKAEKVGDLHKSIFKSVQRSLPAKYKAQSLALSEAIITEAQAHDFDPVFVLAVIQTESAFNPTARGLAGEIGLMQIKPKTAYEIAKQEKLKWRGNRTLENPIMNIKIGITHMAKLRNSFVGFPIKYVSAYNLGAKKVRNLSQQNLLPKVYSKKVLKNYIDLYSKLIVSHSAEVARPTLLASQYMTR
jgi:soluble lytic murein transglycosylase